MRIRRLPLCISIMLAASACAKQEALQYDSSRSTAVEFASHLVTEASSGFDKALVHGSRTPITSGQKFEADFIPYAMKDVGVQKSMENYCRGRGGVVKSGSCKRIAAEDSRCSSIAGWNHCVSRRDGEETSLFAWNIWNSRSLRGGSNLVVLEPSAPTPFGNFDFRSAVEAARAAHLKAGISDPAILGATESVVVAGQSLLVDRSRQELQGSYKPMNVTFSASRLDDACLSVWYRIGLDTPSYRQQQLKICGVKLESGWMPTSVTPL